MEVKIKVLVVDDDQRMVKTIGDILKIKGFEAVAAYTGEEAIECVKSVKPDCVLMDIKMPGGAGIETLAKIKDLAPDLPVIIMSAYATEEEAAEVKKQGAYSLLTKPLDIQMILTFLSLLRREQTVLIVDDDPNVRKTLTDILKIKGYEPFAAKDGREGLALLDRHRPQVVLIDLGLPDVSGLEVLKTVRTEFPTTEAIIVTGNASLDSAIEATNKGAFSYIQKPYDMERLLLLVRHAVEKWELADKLRLYQEHLEELVRERTKELESARDAAEAGNRVKTDFIANMGHEIRTPLNSIIGFSQVLRDELIGGVNEKQKEYIDNILNNGRSLNDLILNILDFAAADSNQMDLQVSGFNIQDIIDSSVAMMKEDLSKHQLSLVVEPGNDIEIEADAIKLKCILLHLLSNAVKFTHDGGSVRIIARKVQSSEFQSEKNKNSEPGTLNAELDADFVEISVADTGIGISSDDLPRLFKEFSQLETPLTKKYKGTGLGLALTRKLVELHGGKIWAESEFGKGSRFVFVMPVRQRKSAEKSEGK